MNLIFDTNAVLFIARDKTYQRVIDFFNPEQKDIFLSFVTIAETQAFAFRMHLHFLPVKSVECHETTC